MEDDTSEDSDFESNVEAVRYLDKITNKARKNIQLKKRKSNISFPTKTVKAANKPTEFGTIDLTDPIFSSLSTVSVNGNPDSSSGQTANQGDLELLSPVYDSSGLNPNETIAYEENANMPNILEGTYDGDDPDFESTGISPVVTPRPSKPLNMYTTYQSFMSAFTQYEIDTVSKYNIKNSHRDFEVDVDILPHYLSSIIEKKEIVLYWQHQHKNELLPIPFCGMPFLILNKRECRCHQGRDKDAQVKKVRKIKRKESAATSVPQEHSTGFKSRKHIQNTKKLNCPVQFIVKKLLYFPTYTVPISSTKFMKNQMMKKLKDDLMEMSAKIKSNVESVTNPMEIDFKIHSQATESSASALTTSSTTNSGVKLEEKKINSQCLDIQVLLNYLVQFPEQSEHRYHHQGQAAGLIEPLDDRVREHIKSLVRTGVRRKAEILSRTLEFVNNNIFDGQVRLRRRFKPDSKTINNIVASVKLETKYSKFDQENLRHALEEGLLEGNFKYFPKGCIPKVEDLLDKLEANEDWEDLDDISINMTTGTEDVKLCFVYQSRDMQRLYRKYGVNLVLLDATHKVGKYTIPLYLLEVQTNVNFQVVAVIAIEVETSEFLSQAMKIVKSWNPKSTQSML